MAEPKDPGGSPTSQPVKVTPTPAPKPAPKPAPAKKTPAQIAAEKKKAADAKAKAEAAAKKAAGTAAAETAASFGWSIAFFNSIPELKTLIANATKEGWSPARFTAALQGTKWFRTTTESQRKYATLRSTDPASFRQQIDEGYNHVQVLAAQMGARITPNWARQIADTALRLGWSEDHLRRYMMTQTVVDGNGNYKGGQAATLQSQFRSLAEQYGVNVSEGLIQQWVRSGITGGETPESVKAKVQTIAASKYPALADRIKAGETVDQIADPYKQSYAKLLEVNPQNLNLDDPLIQRALQAKDGKGKPTTQTVYDFENTLRNDPRWAKTDNARDQMSATANSILQSFGVVG